MFRRFPSSTRALLASVTFVVGCSEAASDLPETEGTGSGAGSGEASCWVASSSGVCPAQPIGSLPADCPSGGIFEGSGFVAGTGICQPHLADWDCPEGWAVVPMMVDGSGAENPPAGMPQSSRCEPPPLTADCPAGSFAIPGNSTCQPLGTTCPDAVDRWPDEATLRAHATAFTGPILYAAADGATDGAGTRASPRLLSAATLRAAETGIVALALGTYNAAIRLDRRVALVGACVTGTTVTSDQPSDGAGVIDIASGAPAALANLTITGERPGVWIRGTLQEPHTITAVEIRDTRAHGLLGDTAQRIELRDIRVTNIRPRASDGAAGRGMQFTGGARVTLSGLDLSGADQVGLLVSDDGTSLTADRLYLHDMVPNPRSTGGRGLAVVEGGVATVAASVVERAVGGAVYLDAGTLEGVDLVLQDTQPLRIDDGFGEGLALTNGAVAQLQRTIVRRNIRTGFSIGAASRLSLSDGLIEDQLAQRSDGDFGDGLIVFARGDATITRTLFRRNRQGAARVSDRGSLLEVTDSLIEETAPRLSDSRLGYGFEAFDAGAGTVRRTLFRRNSESGVLAIGVGSTITASDLLITDTVAPSDAVRIGVGVGVRDGAQVTAQRIRCDRNVVAGIYVRDPLSGFIGSDLHITGGPYAPDTVGILSSDGANLSIQRATVAEVDNVGLLITGAGSSLAATDLLVEQTGADLVTGLNGRAIEVTAGARLTLDTALLRDNIDIALLAIDRGTEVTARNLAIEGTRPRPAPRSDFGTAVGIYDDARFTGTGLWLLNNAQCGLQLAGEGALFDIDGATIAGNRVGLSVQQEGAGTDFVRAHLRGEAFADNGEDVAFSVLPIPDPSGALP